MLFIYGISIDCFRALQLQGNTQEPSERVALDTFAVDTADLLLRQGHWRAVQSGLQSPLCVCVAGRVGGEVRLIIGKSGKKILFKWASRSSCFGAFTESHGLCVTPSCVGLAFEILGSWMPL